MGDVGDAFRAMNEASKEHRADKQNWSKELLQEWCIQKEVDMREVAPWRFRLSKGDKKMDIYPQRQKWHNLKNNIRGKYINLINFVTAHFK